MEEDNGPVAVLKSRDAKAFESDAAYSMEVQGTDSCAQNVAVCSNIELLLRISWEISDGMVFLSSRRYIHRDLAARSILLTADMAAKISDFGLCRYTDEELYTAKSEQKLPWKWMAPESLRDVAFSTQSDV